MKMIVHCKHDKMVKIADLKPNPKNRNQHSIQQIERFAKILAYQGIRRPVRVSKRSGLMTVGHGMMEAAQINGWKELPVDLQEYDSEAQEIADLNADNALGHWSDLDLAGVNEDFVDLGPDFDVDLLGIENFEIEPADKETVSFEISDSDKFCPECGSLVDKLVDTRPKKVKKSVQRHRGQQR